MALRYGVGRCALVSRRRVVWEPGFRKFGFSPDGGGGAQWRRFIGSQCTRAHVELKESCSGRLVSVILTKATYSPLKLGDS